MLLVSDKSGSVLPGVPYPTVSLMLSFRHRLAHQVCYYIYRKNYIDMNQIMNDKDWFGFFDSHNVPVPGMLRRLKKARKIDLGLLTKTAKWHKCSDQMGVWLADAFQSWNLFCNESLHKRGAEVQWLARSLITRPARVRFPDQAASIIRCKNMALYITDCVSLCLSDDTLKAVGPFYRSGGYAKGRPHWLC